MIPRLLTGLMYFQTISPVWSTSINVPCIPNVMRVLPFASLVLPDIAEEYMSVPMSQDQVKLSGPYGSVVDIS